MKKVLILALAIVMSASLAFAQNGGHIGLYSDAPGYSDCNLVPIIGINNVYVVHTTSVTSTSAQFKVENNWLAALAFPPNWGTNLAIGDPYVGVAITYAGCKPMPYLLGTLQFFNQGVVGPCGASLQVVADPVHPSGSVVTVDCDFVLQLATGGLLTVNGNAIDCPCIIGTEESSWSKVKALYQ
jgi:hypothetical protein